MGLSALAGGLDTKDVSRCQQVSAGVSRCHQGSLGVSRSQKMPAGVGA